MPSKRAAAKLASLKRKAEKAVEEPEKGEGEGAEKTAKENDKEVGAEPLSKKMKFRNYRPHDAGLRQGGEEETSKQREKEKNSTKYPTEMIKQEMENGKGGGKEGGGVKKKPHDDLKAQIEPKLLRLKKYTTRAIVDILRAKLKNENAAE